MKVLMIGNSLTYANELPAVVEKLLDAAGYDATVDSVASPDVSLGDQWQKGKARSAIAEGKYDVVVLQQGPSSVPENRMILARDAVRFAEAIRASGAKPALYMVWPSRGRSQDWDGVDTSYTSAAKTCKCLLLPAGRAWRLALKEKEDCPVYGSDGFHPSPTGSYLAALVIAAGITGKPVETFPALHSADEATMRLLHDAAREAISVAVP